MAGSYNFGVPLGGTSGSISAGSSSITIGGSAGAQTVEVTPGYTVFNIVDFGAVCDGSTDDTLAWQNALASAGSVTTNGGGCVYHPGGTSVISSPLTLPNKTSVRGSNSHYASVFAANGASVSWMIASEAFVNNSSSADFGQQISNITWNGNSANHGTAPALNSGSVSATSVGANVIILSSNAIIDHSQFYNAAGHGLQFVCEGQNGSTVVAGTCVQNRIEECLASTAGGHCIYIQDSHGKLTDGYLLDCIVSNATGSGVRSDNTSGWRVSGGHAYTNGLHGFDLQKGFSTRISDLYVEQFGTLNTFGLYVSALKVGLSGPNGGTTINGCTLTGNELQAGNTYRYIEIDGASNTVCDASIDNVTILGVSGSTISTGLYTSVGSGGILNLNTGSLYMLNMHTQVTQAASVNINASFPTTITTAP